MAGNKVHQRCIHYGDADVSVCKLACDGDKNCKGYVEGYGAFAGKCQIATTSSCSEDFYEKNVGSVGNLDPNSDCLPSLYLGCFIKQSSGITNSNGRLTI